MLPEKIQSLTRDIPVTIIYNKCDLAGREPAINQNQEMTIVNLSAKTGAGLDLLKQHLKESMGYQEVGEGNFSARRRHLQSLDEARNYLGHGQQQLLENGAAELLAEDLRQCQQHLGEITGAISNDELLGKIFLNFCIGK